MHIQSVILPKTKYKTRSAARKWVTAHGFRGSIPNDVNPESLHWWRFRQRVPTDYKKGSFRTLPLKGSNGGYLIVGALL